MTLLQRVIDGASGDEAVATLLRQIKVLAARTGGRALADWVAYELNGYPPDVDLPAYRGPINVTALGHFVGIAGAEAQNVPIPPMTIPDDIREAGAGLFTWAARQSVATLQQWVAQEELSFTWPADTVRAYNGLVAAGRIDRIVREDMVLVGVALPVGTAVVVGILDAVRNRILDLALELEQVAPEAGQPDATDETHAAAASVVNHFTISGGANLSVGDHNQVTQTVSPPGPGDIAGLIRFLGAAGIPPEQLVDLQQAALQDQNEPADVDEAGGRRWSRTRAWLVNAATDASTGAVGGALGTAMTTFLG